MSKYEELASVAIDFGLRLSRNQDNCRGFAGGLMCGLAEYLELPQTRFFYAELLALDPEFNFKTPGDARVDLGWPTLREGRDGFFYFAVQIHFTRPKGNMDVYLPFGVLQSGDDFLVLRGQTKKKTQINPESDEDREAFFGAVFDDLKEWFLQPVGEARTRFGFFVVSSGTVHFSPVL